MLKYSRYQLNTLLTIVEWGELNELGNNVPDILENAVIVKGMRIREIARHTTLAPATIRKLLRELGLYRYVETGPKKLNLITKEDLEILSTAQIVEKYNVSRATVYEARRKFKLDKYGGKSTREARGSAGVEWDISPGRTSVINSDSGDEE